MEIQHTVFRIPKKWEITRKGFSEDIGHSSVLEMKTNGMERTLINQKGKWNNEANQMIKHFEESGHPIFRGTSALNRGILRRTEGRKATHFTAESVSIEPLLRKIHSANQLSIYGAVSSWCDELAEQMLGQTSLGVDTSTSKVNDQLSKQLDPQEVGSWVQTEDRGSRGKLLAWSLTTIQDTGSWRTIPYNPWISRINETSLCWNVLQNQWWCERWIWKSLSIIQRVFINSCSSRYCGQALDTKSYRDRTSFRPLLHAEITPMFGWSYPETQTPLRRCVTIQGSRILSRKPWGSRFGKHVRNWCRRTSYAIETWMQFIWWPHSY